MAQPQSAAPLSALLLDEAEFGSDALLRAHPCVSTGFPALDRLLGGGLSPGLTVLGASPGLGKSTLALNIAQHAAAHGSPVRYYSYEMPPKRLGMKLITRENFLRGGSPLFSVKDLFDADTLRGWTDGWEAYRQARRQVAERLDRLYIIDCDAGGKAYTAEDIRADFFRFMEEQGGTGGMPLLIVDYLQILPLEDGVRVSDARQAVDHNVRKMTALSKAFGGVAVLLISSLGRSSYKIPVQIDSFKESGSIEFSADTLLGIQFSACQGQDGSPNREWNMIQEKDKNPREMDLVVLKQRYGETGKVPFLYYAAYDCFTEAGDRPTAAPLPRTEEASPAQAAAPSQTAAPAPTASPLSQPPAAEQAEAAEEIPLVEEVVRPRTQGLEKACMNNTMIAHSLRGGGGVPGDEQSCRVIPAKGISTRYTISAELSCGDCDVADAVYSLFLTEKYFSPENSFSLRRLLTLLTGDSRQTLTARRRDTLLASLDRLQGATLSIRCGEELEARGMDRKYEKAGFDQPRSFLRLAQHNGRYYFPSVQLAEVLPLYAYATMTGQVISFPTALLSARPGPGKKPLSSTAEAIAIRHFLIYRLEVVRNRKSPQEQHKMRTIALGRDSQLFRLLRIRREDYSSADWSRRCRRVAGLVADALEAFRQTGYIQGYVFHEESSVTVSGAVADPWTLDYEP